MIAALMFTGCAVHRDLRISEVGLHAMELYFAEESGNRLALADHTLKYKNSNGQEGEVDLGVFGTLPGGGWLVVWEEQNYSGTPEKEDFLNIANRYVPGIKVSDGFFGTGISYSYRVSGKHNRGFITDKTDDVVKFGVQPRPSIGGTFVEDGSLANKLPRGSRNISRKWGGTTRLTTTERTIGEKRLDLLESLPTLP